MKKSSSLEIKQKCHSSGQMKRMNSTIKLQDKNLYIKWNRPKELQPFIPCTKDSSNIITQQITHLSINNDKKMKTVGHVLWGNYYSMCLKVL